MRSKARDHLSVLSSVICHLSSVICHVVNGLADLDVLDYGGAEMIAFFAPGIGVSANTIRAVEPA
jgi:hypothetical protein